MTLTQRVYSVSLFLLVSALGASSQAKNPAMQLCVRNEAFFIALREANADDEDQVDERAACLVGEGLIGAFDLFTYKTGQSHPEAVINFFKYSNPVSEPQEACPSTWSGVEVQGERNWTFCVYSDGSMIERNTLLKGSQAPQNARLLQLLKKN